MFQQQSITRLIKKGRFENVVFRSFVSLELHLGGQFNCLFNKLFRILGAKAAKWMETDLVPCSI